MTAQDYDNPMLFGTRKDYAWNAWQTVLGPAANEASFDAWWDVACNQSFANVRDLMQTAWAAAIRSLPQFSAWWKKIIDSQPVTK